MSHQSIQTSADNAAELKALAAQDRLDNTGGAGHPLRIAATVGGVSHSIKFGNDGTAVSSKTGTQSVTSGDLSEHQAGILSTAVSNSGGGIYGRDLGDNDLVTIAGGMQITLRSALSAGLVTKVDGQYAEVSSGK